MGKASVKCCVCCCYTVAHACLQALQYKTQATQAQLKAQQETEARKRIEAEAARAVAARMTEKPRVSSPFSSTTGRCAVLDTLWGQSCFHACNLTASLHLSGCPACEGSGLCLVLQSEYGLEASYSGGQAAFASAYGGPAGYPSSAAGTSGQDAYGGTTLYSQGFAAASQVGPAFV